MSTEAKNILDIGSYILTEIFSLISTNDRKNVRLSCKPFYEACNRRPIFKREKFVLRRKSQLSDFGEVLDKLMQTNRNLLNLEFRNVNCVLIGSPWAEKFSKTIWESCGANVHSLHFYHSPIGEVTIKNILMNCPNLKELKMGWRCNWNAKLDTMEFLSPRPFTNLARVNNVRFSSLEFVEIIICYDSFEWTLVMQDLLAVLPNLKTFRLIKHNHCCLCPAFYRHFRPRLDATSIRENYTSVLEKCLQSPSIERIQFRVPISNDWLGNPSSWQRNPSSSRLKEVIFDLQGPENVFSSLLEFFSHHEYIEVVSLFVTDLPENLYKNLIFHILETLPNLRKLRIQGPINFVPFSIQEFGPILNKPLEYLDINGYVRTELFENLVMPENQSLYTTLKTFLTRNFLNASMFLDKFVHIRHLRVFESTDAVLQTIFKNLVNLEALELIRVSPNFSSDFGFTGRYSNNPPAAEQQPTYSFRQLQNLQYLAIRDIRLENFSEVTFSEFVLPRLKAFGLTFFSSRPLAKLPLIRILETIGRNSPELEMLSLDYDFFVSLDVWQLKATFSRMRNLRSVYALPVDFRDFENERLQVQRGHENNSLVIFRLCKSLQSVFHGPFNYHRDPDGNSVNTESICETGFYLKPGEVFDI